MIENFKTLTILYVEDEELIRQNAVEYLGRICKKVLEAKDGHEAYKIYEQQKPDIIISDIQMPKVNGLEFAKQIRKIDKSTPIIIVTAHTQTEYLLKAVELQLVKYIVKPVTSFKLKEALTLAHEHLSCTNIVKLDEKTMYDTLNKILCINNAVIKLTKNERLLLEVLVKNHGDNRSHTSLIYL